MTSPSTSPTTSLLHMSLQAASVGYGSTGYEGAGERQTSSSARFSIESLWRQGYSSAAQLSTIKSGKVRAFYEQQNALLEGMARACQYRPRSTFPEFERVCSIPEDIRLLIESDDGGGAGCGESKKERQVRQAIILTNVANAFLLCAQIFAFISTSSYSILAVFVDSLLDACSGLIILFTWYLRKRKDHRYPVGRQRLEPLGVIFMSCLMTAATLLTLTESISTLIENEPRTLTITLSTCVILFLALIVKGALFVYCSRIDDESVSALASDHFNDVLSNITGIASIFLANYFGWRFDPAFAILISLLIIRTWGLLTWEHCERLLGKNASPSILNLITFLALNHNSHILAVDTVRGYHSGTAIYAEIHVVLDGDMPLAVAHDIGESLQNRVEELEGVERSFVHLDVESNHSPKQEHKDL